MAPTETALDHIVPLARGGVDDDCNIQLAHRRCNMAKGAMLPEEYVEYAALRDAKRERQLRSRVQESMAHELLAATDMEERITLRQAADLSHRDLSTLRHAAIRGTLRAVKEDTPRGPVWYTTRADLAAYVEHADAWPANPKHRPRGAKEEGE